MGRSKRSIITNSDSDEEESVQLQNNAESGDISMTDSSEDEEVVSEEPNGSVATAATRGSVLVDDVEIEDEEEEDEIIKAIRRENTKEADHPKAIICEDFVTDISFHPHEDILAVGTIVGDVILYKYSVTDENYVLKTLEVHTKSCRDIEFSEDGKALFSIAKDKSIMLSDVESGKLIRFYDNSHEVPAYCITVLDAHTFATGDDNGVVKLWDLRVSKDDKAIFHIKKNDDYISDIVTDEALQYLLCSSGDGSLTTIDLQNRKFLMQSEEYEEELTCLGVFRKETKLLAGSSKGNLFLYNWKEFGLHSDSFPGPKSGINSLIPITENIVVTACEDGVLRGTHLFPHWPLGVVGQHDLSIECVDICNNGTFIASSSHNNDIKFWNIQYFEEFENVSHKHKKHNRKKEMEHNLPSSARKNVADFFSDLN